MADGVEQMGLAAPGAAMEEERIERDLVGGGERTRGVERHLIGLADDEILEAVARLERRGVETAQIFAEHDRLGLDWRGNIGDRLGTRHFAARADLDPAHRRQHRAPRQREPVGEMGLDPIGHELRRQLESQRRGLRIEAAERDRAQPTVEGARAAVAAQPRADHRPCSRDRILRSLVHGQCLTFGWLIHAGIPPATLPLERLIFLGKAFPPRQTPRRHRLEEGLYCVRPSGDSPRWKGCFRERIASRSRVENVTFVK